MRVPDVLRSELEGAVGVPGLLPDAAHEGLPVLLPGEDAAEGGDVAGLELPHLGGQRRPQGGCI